MKVLRRVKRKEAVWYWTCPKCQFQVDSNTINGQIFAKGHKCEKVGRMVDPFELNQIRDDAFNAGVEYAENRIVKLLEERYAENVDHCEWGTHLFLDNAIALIKGEK